MARITSDEVSHLALLCRIAMSEDEVELMRDQMSNILDNIDVLNQVETAGVEPTGHSVDLVSVMRDDVVTSSTNREEMLSNAPNRDGDFIRVRAVLES